jgi:carbon starvation protein
VPAVGYWAQHNAFKEALAAGEETFGTATSREAMEAVVRNTFVQGTLSILFVVLTIIVIAVAIYRTIRAFSNGGGVNTEDPAVPSRIFGASGLITTKSEKRIQKQWDALPAEKRREKSRH